MKLTGIADEAGPGIDEQIRAHQLLGWTHLELRTWEGRQVAQLPETACRELAGRIKDAGLAAGLTPSHCWPGEGVCRIPEILAALAASSYQGFLSIEPHLGVHPDCGNLFDTYVEYGRRMEALYSRIGVFTSLD